MLSRISRLPLRRCLHTGAPAANSASPFGRTAKIIAGASVFSAAAYLTWRLRDRHIALDSPKNSHNSSSPSTSKSGSSSGDAPASGGAFNPETGHNSTSPSTSTSSPLSTDSDTISGDAKKEENVDGESPSSEDAGDREGSSSGDAPASGGAFNPETGEINWDCPCLGGMAHGPCGPEFKEAFSCFVYSEAEPKGINCVDKFQNMQTCFKAHPEIYADEIANDDDEEQPPPKPESPNTDEVDNDATPELKSPSKPPIGGEVSSQNNDEEQPPHPKPEFPNTDKVDDDATPKLKSPSKPPVEGDR